jgi:hypothetical protein
MRVTGNRVAAEVRFGLRAMGAFAVDGFCRLREP